MPRPALCPDGGLGLPAEPLTRPRLRRALVLDVSTETKPCKLLRRLSSVNELSYGPQKRGDLFRWARMFCCKLEGNDSGVDFFRPLVDKLANGGCSIVTDYSGIGAPELAADHILAEARRREQTGKSLSLHFSRASEMNPVCQKVLLMHAKSDCVMGDQLERIPPTLLHKAKAILRNNK